MVKFSAQVLEAGKAAVVAALCVGMVSAQALAEVPAAAEAHVAIPAPVKKTVLTQDEKTLHALNRMTFGPRPGDEQVVDKMGMEAWFERQLHPETIDDSAFEARLAQYPALRLSQQELMARFPTPQTIKEMARRGTALPRDPVEHAIYADSMAAYEEKIEQAAAVPATGGISGGAETRVRKSGPGAPGLSPSPSSASSPDSTMSGDMAMAAPEANAQAKGKKHGLDAEPMDEGAVEALIALPPDQRMARLVAMSPEEMAGLRKAMRRQLMGPLVQGFTPVQKEEVAAMQGGPRVVAAEALEERMLRDVYSERQLQAVMDDFWLNHFSVYVKKNQNEPYFLASYDRDAVLPNSMGKFENLLVATAKSPAMLMYLDNWQSIGPNSMAATRGKRFEQGTPGAKLAKAMPKGINENYARELMELHTLGVGGGYTQKDVIEVAKCFTGWTIDRPYQGGGGEFVFEPNRHEPGSKTVLGHVIPEGGESEGLEVLHILATSPATARFVSNKLAVRFVSDTPPPALVDRMAATFLKSNGDIKAVLTTMFHSPEFWAPSVYRAKVKTPIEFMASALRASDAQIGNPVALVQAMTQLGMPIYGMQTPNGYSWKADEWVSSNALVSRMNFALVLSGGRVQGARTDWPQLLGDSEDSSVTTSPSAKTELQLETLILGEAAAARTRATVLDQFNNPTAQHSAEQSLAMTAQKPEDGDDMVGSAGLLRVKAGNGRGRGQGQGFQADKPETPLDTMAGLLLGSPDFQRR